MTGSIPKRLSKALQAAGIASRRESEAMIIAGRVRVNGDIILLPQTMVRVGVDCIEVDDESIRFEEKKVYYVLNKPRGVVCSFKRNGKQKIVSDLFKGESSRLFYIGRLDKDTEGLLLVTNDGDFAQRVIHPSSGLHREYIAKTDYEITAEHLQRISRGMRIAGDWVRPVRVSKIRKGTVKVVLSQGKKHEVRRLLDEASLSIYQLKRTRIGDFHLGALAPGEWRPLTEMERQSLLSVSRDR